MGSNSSWLMSFEEEIRDTGTYRGRPCENRGKTAMQTKERGFGMTTTADTWILDFEFPELWRNTFLSLKPANVRHFVLVAVANSSVSKLKNDWNKLKLNKIWWWKQALQCTFGWDYNLIHFEVQFGNNCQIWNMHSSTNNFTWGRNYMS